MEAEIIRFEAGADAPQCRIHLPDAAVSIEVDAAAIAAQRSGGRIEVHVRRVRPLVVALRRPLQAGDYVGRAADAARGGLAGDDPVALAVEKYVGVSADNVGGLG